jgi:hypothetical protein
MANEYILQDLIDRYILNELEGEALDKFKKKLREDSEFAKMVELQEALVSQIQEERKAELKSYIEENSKVEYIQNIWGKKWMYASAAIIAVTIGLYFTLQRMEQIPEVASNDKSDTQYAEEDIAGNGAPIETDSNDTLIDTSQETLDEPVFAVEDRGLIAEADKDELTNTDDQVNVLSELSMDEKKIAAKDDEIVLKDSLILTKNYVVAEIPPLNLAFAKDVSEDDLESVAVREEKERGKLFGNRRDKTSKNKVESLDSLADDATSKPAVTKVELKTQTIGVQFWKSVIGFKGYRYSEGRVQLYGISTDAILIFKKYQDSLYINISGTYFALIGNGQFNKYQKVTDAALLENLSR